MPYKILKDIQDCYFSSNSVELNNQWLYCGFRFEGGDYIEYRMIIKFESFDMPSGESLVDSKLCLYSYIDDCSQDVNLSLYSTTVTPVSPNWDTFIDDSILISDLAETNFRNYYFREGVINKVNTKGNFPTTDNYINLALLPYTDIKYMKFYSINYIDENLHPYMEVQYTSPPEILGAKFIDRANLVAIWWSPFEDLKHYHKPETNLIGYEIYRTVDRETSINEDTDWLKLGNSNPYEMVGVNDNTLTYFYDDTDKTHSGNGHYWYKARALWEDPYEEGKYIYSGFSNAIQVG